MPQPGRRRSRTRTAAGVGGLAAVPGCPGIRRPGLLLPACRFLAVAARACAFDARTPGQGRAHAGVTGIAVDITARIEGRQVPRGLIRYYRTAA
jgi:hypothetical protein